MIATATKTKSAILERVYRDSDCGCPVVEWVYCGTWLQIHLNLDGTANFYADGGDWDHNVGIDATSVKDARRQAFAWVDALPFEDR